MNSDNAKNLIEAEYTKLQGDDQCSESQIYYNLIIAKDKFGCKDFIQSDYLDAKNYIIALFDEIEHKDFGYDTIPESQLIKVINLFPSEERVPLCKLALRKSSELGLRLNDIDKIYYNSYKSELIKDHKILTFLSLILGHKIWIMLGSYALFLVVISLMLLPAPFEWMEILNSKLVTVSQISFLNYPANALIWLFGINYSPFCITPIGITGVMVYCLGKIFAFLFIGNFLFQKLSSYIAAHYE